MKECPCGQPLHYSAPDVQAAVELLVEKMGPDALITCDGRSWLISRHFIALHGVRGKDLPALAQQYGFKEVTGLV